MDPQLPKIEPELEFICELNKQSTCPLQLLNGSDQVLAFKVKTTHEKVYAVRPNIGIVHPMSTCDITITRQAQKVAPPDDIQCKEKFLIQSMIVPFGTTNKDITSSMFYKDNEMHIEEKKLKVVLIISPRYSPVLLAINGTPKEKPPTCEAPVLKDQVLSGSKNPLQSFTVVRNTQDLKLAMDVHESKVTEDKQDAKLGKHVEEVIDVEKLQLTKEIEKLKSRLDKMELKLDEFEDTIKSLREERIAIIDENNTLKQELAGQQRKKWRMGMGNGVFSFFGFSNTCTGDEKYVPLLQSG